MLDAFDHEYIPEHLLTQEFLKEVKSLLAPGGVLAANTFSSSRLYDHESVDVCVGVRAVLQPEAREPRDHRAAERPLPDAAAAAREQRSASTGAFDRYGFSAAELLPLFTQRAGLESAARES